MSGVVINGDNNKIEVFNIRYSEANLIQNQAQKLQEDLSQATENVYLNVLLRVTQAKDAKHPQTGERGVVESISKKSIRLRFSSAEDHDKMVSDPFGQVYLVDLKVETIDSEPKLYVVNRVIDSFLKDEM